MSAKPHILVVDDERYMFETIASLLRSEGYDLEFAQSGQEALEKVSAIIPDIILLDVVMDDMDGYDVCALMRAEEMLRDIIVFFDNGA